MNEGQGKQSKHENLAEADRHIAQAQSLIARQQNTVTELERDGHDAETARALLQTMIESLDQMRHHRAIIEAEAARAKVDG